MNAIHTQKTRISSDTDLERQEPAKAIRRDLSGGRAPRNSREECVRQCEALDRAEGRRFEMFPRRFRPSGFLGRLKERLALARLRRWEALCDFEAAPLDPCALADLRREEGEIRLCLRLIRAISLRGR